MTTIDGDWVIVNSPVSHYEKSALDLKLKRALEIVGNGVKLLERKHEVRLAFLEDLTKCAKRTHSNDLQSLENTVRDSIADHDVKTSCITHKREVDNICLSLGVQSWWWKY